jgi:hypothetical protein
MEAASITSDEFLEQAIAEAEAAAKQKDGSGSRG